MPIDDGRDEDVDEQVGALMLRGWGRQDGVAHGMRARPRGDCGPASARESQHQRHGSLRRDPAQGLCGFGFWVLGFGFESACALLVFPPSDKTRLCHVLAVLSRGVLVLRSRFLVPGERALDAGDHSPY
eukprot:3215825-Rhodomonas_salina.2